MRNIPRMKQNIFASRIYVSRISETAMNHNLHYCAISLAVLISVHAYSYVCVCVLNACVHLLHCAFSVMCSFYFLLLSGGLSYYI